MMTGPSGRSRRSTGTTLGDAPVTATATAPTRGPRGAPRGCAPAPRGPTARRTASAGRPARPSPRPAGTSDRTAGPRPAACPTRRIRTRGRPTCPRRRRSARPRPAYARPAYPRLIADQLGVGTVLVQADQGPVERAGRVVAARVEDHAPALAQAADAAGLVDVAVQPAHRLAFGLDVAHRGAADRLVLDLAQPRLDPEVVVEGGRVVQLGRIRRRGQGGHGAFRAL